MKTVNPEYAEMVAGVVNNCNYFNLLSMGIRDLSWGRAVVELDPESVSGLRWCGCKEETCRLY
ncbi:MAG: hypothetical protein ACLFOY_00065 [Desulfatibacillaceae bacterium]